MTDPNERMRVLCRLQEKTSDGKTREDIVNDGLFHQFRSETNRLKADIMEIVTDNPDMEPKKRMKILSFHDTLNEALLIIK